ncbi:MAG: diguanylate cyclase, partial [Methylococcales bacterium]
MKRPKILIVDDERFFVNILIDLLDPDYDLEVASNGEKAIAMASTSPAPDLILLDILIPDIDGYEICTRLKENSATQYIPIIFLTVKSDVEDEAKGLGLGAADYITKPISPPILKARVRTQLLLEQAQRETERYSEHLEQLVSERTQELTKEIGERKKVEEHLRIQANYDPLTRLPNRALYMERLAQAIKHAQRNKLSLSVLLIDLDNFKIINDTMGHHIGDVLLVEAAKRLKDCIRDEDTVARLGGDEFLLILLEISEQESAALVAQKLLNELAKPFTLSNGTYHISASIGITLFPRDSQGIDELIKNADVSMYQAKKKGRNRFEFFTPEMTTMAQHRLGIAKALRKGVDNNELTLHYQPIVDMISKHPVATEALIRWNHPGRGLLSPRDFIPVAEETDLID